MNIVFFAAREPLSFDVPRAAAGYESEPCRRVAHGLGTHEIAARVSDGTVLTDALNPLSRLQLVIADHHFDAMESLLPREFWLP